MNARHLVLLGAGFVGGALLPHVSGCVEPDPNHCYNNDGDSYCAAKHPDWETAYCSDSSCVSSEPDGCVQELPTGCWFCDGKDGGVCDDNADTTGTGTSTDTGDGDTTSTDDTTETSGDTTTGPECMSSDECDGETPLCDAGSCVSCADAVGASCETDYPGTPVCGADGLCAECSEEDTSACDPSTPACEAGVCVTCDEHSECPDSACNMKSGACMPTDRVWWVDNSVNEGGDGSEQNPFSTISTAFAELVQTGVGTIVVLGGGTGYSESVSINPGQTVALIGVGGPFVDVAGQAMFVDAGGVMFVHGFGVVGGTTGLNCMGGEVWLDSSSVVENIGTGGVSVGSGSVMVRNSFVGGLTNTGPAISVGQGSVSIVYSTLATGFDAPAVECLVGGGGSEIRNSLVVSRADTDEIVGCTEIDVTDSALEMMLGENVALGPVDAMAWFENFNGADFHLTVEAPAELATAAIWQPGDPRTDIDGDPRPATADAPDYAGADVP